MSKRTQTAEPVDVTPPAPYDPVPFQLARDDVRDLITMPLHAWTLIPPARRKQAAYTALMSVPLDMAAAGFDVTVKQDDAGWYVELSREVVPGYMVRIAGRARSYLATLYQVADAAPGIIGQAERRAKRADSQQDESAT